MGRRSRKRTSAAHTTEVPRPPAAPPGHGRPPGRPLDRRARLEEAPKAPWSPFPLVELTVLIALVMIAGGFVATGHRRVVLFIGGVTLATLAGLEVSIREHFAGYRSHTTLLAGICAIAVIIPLFYFTRLPQEALLGVAVLVFGTCFYLLRAAFARRTGGLGFRA